MQKKFLFVSFLVLIIFSLPRFNYVNLLGITIFGIEMNPDSIQYQYYTNYFKGDISAASHLLKPFTYRILSPFTASLLPFDALTSLNIINLISLLLTLYVLSKILINLGFSQKFTFLGCLFFSFSFPVLYYGTIGMIDPVIVFFITLGVFLILNKKWIWLPLCFLFGILTKEMIILLFPFLVAALFFNKNLKLWKKIFIIFLNLLIVFTAYYFIRKTVPGGEVSKSNIIYESYNWIPSVRTFLYNTARPKAWFSLILSLSFHGALALWYIGDLIKNKLKSGSNIEYAFLAGFISSLFVFFYSIIAAYTDGRHVWLTYPFAIPLSLFFLQKKFRNGELKFLSRYLGDGKA